ncbi:MAG: 50S ribosomal protein L17 [Planctomycetes bacterium]|nr:50S ribosomal protein L17 [Planctomycetota bacterium]
MRHRRKGRAFDRSPPHQRALMRSLAANLFLTERNAELDANKPKVRGRIVTTLEKAKEARPIIEKCITIARKSLAVRAEAEKYTTDAERGTDAWKAWRKGEQWKLWNKAIAPDVKARKRVLVMVGNKQAVRILFDDIAPRFADRNGGYTRILRLAKPRLGDNGTRALIELVGANDRAPRGAVAPAIEPEESAT